MPLSDAEQIRKKLLLILRLQGGRWSQEEFDRIDAGAIDVATHLQVLITHGFIYHDRGAQTYVLTDLGGRHLSALSDADTDVDMVP